MAEGRRGRLLLLVVSALSADDIATDERKLIAWTVGLGTKRKAKNALRTQVGAQGSGSPGSRKL